MKNKILVIICVFSLCFSFLAIPSFALESDFTGEYVFAYDLDFNPLDLNSTLRDCRVEFLCNGVQYDMISFVTNINLGEISMHYHTGDQSFMVYKSSVGWYDDTYRFIDIITFDNQMVNVVGFLSFLRINEFVPEPDYSGWYYDIYDTIIDSVFAGNEVDSAERLSVTLVSLLLSLTLICIPFLVVVFIMKKIVFSRYI